MRFSTLYFNTGVQLEYPREYTIHCSLLGGHEDSMWDLIHYAWGVDSVTTVRRCLRMLQRRRRAYPMFQATVDGTRALITHLVTHLDKESKDAWLHLLAAVVLHQMGYQPELAVQFDW